MDVVRRRPVDSSDDKVQNAAGEPLLKSPKKNQIHVKASDALPLPLYLTNVLFFTMFFSVMYYLLHRWREKIRDSIPLHVVTFSELVAMVSLIASVIYLVGFFGIDFVQSLIYKPNHDVWDVEDEQYLVQQEDSRGGATCTTLGCAAVGGGAVPSPLPPKIIPSKFPLEKPSPLVETSEDDEELINSIVSGKTPSYSLESKLGDCKKAVRIRREALERITGKSLEGLPLDGFDYDSILGQCCEMPVGYVQLPVGIAGPLVLDGREYMVPMATTEGCLVASTNRGCKAILASGGATSVLLRDGMTRAPVVRFGTAKRAAELKFFMEDPINFETLSVIFNKSSRFAKLQNLQCAIAGKNLYMRFRCSTGDAMGMNMVSKGVQNVLDFLQSDFPDMEVIGISGNFCADKKPAAVNWIEGRGKSVVCEAIIKEETVKKVLKTEVAALVELNMLKNLTGSAMAGSLGGFNAHASNIVSAVYIATGQDPAQNVESSHCITMMEAVNDGKDLHISVTMPCIENENSILDSTSSGWSCSIDPSRIDGSGGIGFLNGMSQPPTLCYSLHAKHAIAEAFYKICSVHSADSLLFAGATTTRRGWDCGRRNTTSITSSMPKLARSKRSKQRITGCKCAVIGYRCCWLCPCWRVVSNVCDFSRSTCQEPHEIQ